MGSAFDKPVILSPEDFCLAYGCLLGLSIMTISIGAKQSEKQDLRVNCHVVTSGEAWQFPLLASGVLSVIFISIKNFPDEFAILSTNFFFIDGVLNMARFLLPIVKQFPSLTNPRTQFKVNVSLGSFHILLNCTSNYFASLVPSLAIGVLYLMTNHWTVNNIFALLSIFNSLQSIRLKQFRIGIIFLLSFLAYDVFWCFGTNIMETVALKFHAPIMIHFPVDIIHNGWHAKVFTSLGTGDILLPGCFIAMLHRFDISLKRNSSLYFSATIIAYFFGLLATTLTMLHFKRCQPALLYCVPVCVLTPILIATLRGELKKLLNYQEVLDKNSMKT